jgi:hypothetical protein
MIQENSGQQESDRNVNEHVTPVQYMSFQFVPFDSAYPLRISVHLLQMQIK